MTRPAVLNPEPRTLNPSRWQPTGDDHLIFEWVKMQGKTQAEVARMFDINQSTVSRIIQRYERWQAHMKDRENGRLDPSERYRAQKWLTYERNELILASCLRIAGEMEGFTELSKSTISRPVGTADQREVRTEERVIDRHGTAARFLRLAFRINMEQLKLLDEQDAPRPDELSAEELAQEARDAAADAAEIAAARQRVKDELDRSRAPRDVAPAAAHNAAQAESVATGPDAVPSTEHSVPSTAAAVAAVPALSELNPESRTLNPRVHNLHHENAAEITVSPPAACACMLQPGAEKKPACTCIIDCNVGWPGPGQPAATTDLPLGDAVAAPLAAGSDQIARVKPR
jgi:helix-turn-helix protein